MECGTGRAKDLEAHLSKKLYPAAHLRYPRVPSRGGGYLKMGAGGTLNGAESQDSCV